MSESTERIISRLLTLILWLLYKVQKGFEDFWLIIFNFNIKKTVADTGAYKYSSTLDIAVQTWDLNLVNYVLHRVLIFLVSSVLIFV